jgi:hypothetical protein
LAEKYRITFKTLEGQTCIVRFDFTAYSGATTELIGATKPFTLQEYNTDENLFKPVRPLMATINIATNASGVTMDDFIADTDSEIIVWFDFGSWTGYWKGWLLQDDFQETWIDSYHVLTLRASDGLGKLSDQKFTDYSGNELVGTYTPFELMSYCIYNTPKNFVEARIINNLYNKYMTDALTDSPLEQCYIDAKTFQIEADNYDDSLTVLKKINNAFNQTMFFYKSNWWILRLEELYCPTTTNLTGYTNGISGKSSFEKRFDVDVSSTSTVKPINNEMLRYIRRKTKRDIINFYYNQFNEVICNETFSRGDFNSETSTIKNYDLNNWTREIGTIGSPTVVSTGYGRNEEFDANGQLIDNYAYCDSETSSLSWIRSCGLNVLKNERFSIKLNHKYDTTTGSIGTQSVAIIQLIGVSNNYTLDDNGEWFMSNSTWTSNVKILQLYYSTTTGILPQDYQQLDIVSNILPENGIINILLFAPSNTFYSDRKRFNSLTVEIVNPFNGYNNKTIKGIQSVFTKTADVRNDFEDEIYIDDAFSRIFKGTILEDDEITPTKKEWYRRRYDTESYGFRKQNDIAHWEHNRFNRTKLDCNFYGLTWVSVTTPEPIGLINTFRFIDDDPNKIYYILNLKEIDFSSSTWSATLVEVYDADRDNDSSTITKTLDTTTTAGTYNALVYAKLTIVSAADFLLNSNQDQLYYNGDESITVNITARINGYINSRTSSPIEITLRKNATILSTYTLAVPTTPYPFAANLDVAGITIDPGDYLFIQYGSTITQVQVTSGGIDFTYSFINPFNYDDYQDKFLYQ